MVRSSLLLICTVGCTGTAPAPTPSEVAPIAVHAVPLRLDPIGVSRDRPHTTITASAGARFSGQPVSATWQPLLREGQFVGGADFGLLVDERGQPLPEPLCGGADFGALVEAHGTLFHLGHIECRPGALWLTSIQQGTDGSLTPVSTAPVDLSSVQGGNTLCAGDVTPWSSVLSAEESEPDARFITASGRVETDAMVPGYEPERLASYFVPPHLPYVYDLGWVLETRILDAQGGTDVAKHYAMGRFSHEIALVMPDRRTVYLTDDATNGGFFMFVSDQADNLASGTLYAARWTQTAKEGGGQGKLTWISLGPATDDEIRTLATSHGTVHFDDLLRTSEPVDTEATGCTEGFTAVNTAAGAECIAVRPGSDETLLSRLETRRYAAMKGATTEFRKMEGLTWDPDHRVIYAGVAEINKGMLPSNPQWDRNGPDHIGVDENRCGGIYALPVGAGQSDTNGQAIDSPYVATSMRGFVLGRPEGFGCALGVPANPDNVSYLPGSGLLFVAEDSPHHTNNLLWSIDASALHEGRLAEVVPVLAAPPGAEVTGLHWSPDVGGFGYLTTSIQHPWAFIEGGENQPADQRKSVFGVFGPYPRLVPTAPAPDPG